MAITVREALDQVVAVVEGTTPDQPTFDRAPAFRRAPSYVAEGLADNQSPTRRFVLGLAGDRRTTGPMGAAMSPIHVVQTIELGIVYRCPADAWDLLRVVAQDIDRLAWRLSQPALWDTSTSGIVNIEVAEYAVDMDDQANGAAIVTLPVMITYKPAYTG